MNNINPLSSDFTNFVLSPNSQSAKATVQLPDGKEVEVTLTYTKKTSAEQMKSDLQQSIEKIKGLSVAYELGKKTESLTISGNKLTKVYTNEGLAERNAKRSAKKKPKLTERTHVSKREVSEDKIGEKLATLKNPNAKVKEFITSYGSRAQPNLNINTPNRGRVPNSTETKRPKSEPIQMNYIQGNGQFKGDQVEKIVDDFFDDLASKMKSKQVDNSSNVNPEESAKKAKALVKKTIMVLESIGDFNAVYGEKGLMKQLNNRSMSGENIAFFLCTIHGSIPENPDYHENTNYQRLMGEWKEVMENLGSY